MSLRINDTDRKKVVSCYAINQEVGKTKVKSQNLSVLYPPSIPTITGLGNANTSILEGSLIRLVCISMGGNPLADLSWFRRNIKLKNTKTEKSNTGYSKSELLIRANRTDNDVFYECRARSSKLVTGTDLTASVSYNVDFRPSSVKITLHPTLPLKSGMIVTLTCESATSRPPARIMWQNDKLLPSSVSHSVIKEGRYGGKMTISTLEIVVSSKYDGSKFICEAKNDQMHHLAVHDVVLLNVKYKPIIRIPYVKIKNGTINGNEMIFGVNEGESTSVNITARGNPKELTYQWINPQGNTISGLRRNIIITREGIFKIKKANRRDSGQYKVVVSNTEGKSEMNFIINVYYPARIIYITPSVMVYAGESVSFQCVVDANPNPTLPYGIMWRRINSNQSDIRLSNKTNQLFINVINVNVTDTGRFECIVDNGLGNSASNFTYLLVRGKPKIVKSSLYAKVSSEKGETAILECLAKGVPEIEFSWTRFGAVIGGIITKIPFITKTKKAKTSKNMTETFKKVEKYFVESSRINEIEWKSILYVKKVSSWDYGIYECIALNEEGFDRYNIALNVTSAPDTPTNLQVLNVTYNSITLQWQPAHNGGYKQFFIIRYLHESAGTRSSFHFVDVSPANQTVFKISDLKMATEYQFAIAAKNKMGTSHYTSNVLKVSTSSAMTMMTSSSVDDDENSIAISKFVFILISIIGGFIVGTNVLFITFCWTRCCRQHSCRSNHMFKSTNNIKGCINSCSYNGSTKSASVEMYVADGTNSYNNETLSSVSERSGSGDEVAYSFDQPGSESPSQIITNNFAHQQNILTKDLKINDLYVSKRPPLDISSSLCLTMPRRKMVMVHQERSMSSSSSSSSTLGRYAQKSQPQHPSKDLGFHFDNYGKQLESFLMCDAMNFGTSIGNGGHHFLNNSGLQDPQFLRMNMDYETNPIRFTPVSYYNHHEPVNCIGNGHSILPKSIFHSLEYLEHEGDLV